MNSQLFSIPKFNLLEKRYLASRISCFALVIAGLLLQIDSERIFVPNIFWISLIVIFGIQFVYQFKSLNGILGGILILASLYFSLAIWTEFNEFEVVTKSAKQLLLFGFGGASIGIMLSVFMIWSFIRDFK